MRVTHAHKLTQKNAAEVAGKRDNVYKLKSPLQMYTGFYALTQFDLAWYCIALHIEERTHVRRTAFLHFRWHILLKIIWALLR